MQITPDFQNFQIKGNLPVQLDFLLCGLLNSCTVYERKTEDCPLPWTFQHRSCLLCLALWCLPGFITSPLYKLWYSNAIVHWTFRPKHFLMSLLLTLRCFFPQCKWIYVIFDIRHLKYPQKLNWQCGPPLFKVNYLLPSVSEGSMQERSARVTSRLRQTNCKGGWFWRFL